MRRLSLRLLTVVVAIFLAGCEQEQKRVRIPAGGSIGQGVPQSELQPGPEMPVRRIRNPLEGNAHAIGEGRKLYMQFNCVGCHANGGGSIGPPLMDDEWIYGSSAENIYAAIVEGRPQGMPAFSGRIPDYQLWQLVSYVRSLSGLDRDTARTLTQQARTDPAEAERK